MNKRILTGSILMALTSNALAENITVTVENLAPAQGVYFTPVWVGFHDGNFDLFDGGGTASAGLEAVAEDGNNEPLADEFNAAASSGVGGVLTAPAGFAGAPVFDPGDRSSITLDLDPTVNRYMNFATMLLPSNDAFMGNADPLEVFDDNGQFNGPISFVVYGSMVYDAGTEANTESDAAFFNQSAPNTGETTADPIAIHPGFNGSLGNPDATPVTFLGGTSGPGIFFDATAADFTTPGYQVARITIASAAQQFRVAVKNLRPEGGTFLTPAWVGFHDGSFDLYDRGAAVSPGLESVAEDGAVDTLNSEFAAAVADGVQSLALDPAGFGGAPVIDAGGFTGEAIVTLDPTANRYFSYASMVIPSNDAFIANGNPMAHAVFDEEGNFLAPSFTISNQGVLDAGTEVNNEMEAAFLNQTGPNTGEDENGVVELHPGFNGSQANPDATPVNILGGSNDAGLSFDAVVADFSRTGQQIAQLSVTRLIDQSYSGTWFSPDRDGEGFLIDIANGEQPTAVVSFYTYAADGSGDQAWAIGSGPVVDNVAMAELIRSEGATFGSGFNSADIIQTPFGQARITFDSCTEGTLSVTPIADGFEAIEYSIQRLTPLSTNGGNCSQ